MRFVADQAVEVIDHFLGKQLPHELIVRQFGRVLGEFSGALRWLRHTTLSCST